MSQQMHTLGRAVVALVLTQASTACSTMFVEGPHVRAGKVECTEAMTVPVLDAALAVTELAMPFIIARVRDPAMGQPPYPLYFGLWGAGIATSISAVVGVSKVKRCRRTLEAPMPL